MTHRSPVFTLAAVLAAFAVGFGVNTAARPAPAGSPAAGATPATSASATPTSPPPKPTASAAPVPAESPSPSPEPAKTTLPALPDEAVYVGRTRDDTYAVAVAVQGDKAVAYLCDGRDLEAWLKGSAEDGKVSVRGRKDAVLSARLDGEELSGKVRVDGKPRAFGLDEAKRPAGLYRARGKQTTIGWIVLPDGTQVGVQSSAADGPRPAPTLDPEAAVEVDDTPLAPVRVSGGDEL